jgi:uncharacterized protein (DUF58 family)
MLKNRILYVLAISVVGFMDYYYNSFVLDITFFALISIIPLAVISILVTLFIVEIKLVTNKETYKKEEEGTISYNIKNKGFLLISNIIFRPDVDLGVEMDSRPVKTPVIFSKATHSHRIKFTSKYRGEYIFRLKDIYITDYFDLIRLNLKKNNTTAILYLPNIVKTQSEQEHNSNSDEERQFALDFIEQDVMVDIREYAYGDPLKKIHWKLSAKNDRLLVKKYTSNKEKKLVVIIDTLYLKLNSGITKLIIEDQIIERAVSLVYTHLQKYSGVRIMNSMNDSFELNHIKDFAGFYRYLAKHKFESHNSIARVVKSYYEVNEEKLLTDTNNIVIITNKPSPELYGLLVENKYGDHTFKVDAMLYSIQKRQDHLTKLLERMREAGISVEEHWIGGK